MRFGEQMDLVGIDVASTVTRWLRGLGVLAIVCLSLMASQPARAEGSSPKTTASNLRARERALRAYRHDGALGVHRGRRGAAVPLARSAIVGGALDSIQQVPWQVAVFAEFEAEGEAFSILCGGTIIDMSHILTAAHCAYNPANGQPMTPESFVVLAGASRITVEEIENGTTVEGRFVEGVRVHPDFDYAAGPGTPDDVAVLQLESPLLASSGVRQIGLPFSATPAREGTDAVLSGFGQEDPVTEEINGNLYSIGITLGSSRECGGNANALFLCGTSTDGTACNGDSGGALVAESSPTLIGVVDTVATVNHERCRDGAVNGFANLAAPEIRDFAEGNEDPPLAPQGGNGTISGVSRAGQSLRCEPGGWSNAPGFTYAFTDSANGAVLQQGPASRYALSASDVGRSIYCAIEATNAGGTGVGRTDTVGPISPALAVTPPPSAGQSSGTSSNSGGSAGTSSTGSNGGQGVLGFTITTASPTAIAALLRRELTPDSSAKIAKLLGSGGFTVTFKALEAGAGAIAWYQVPAGALLAKKSDPKSLLVASGRLTFPVAGTAKLKLKLTAAGKRLLKGKKRLKLIAKGTFTPPGGSAVTALKTFVLKA